MTEYSVHKQVGTPQVVIALLGYGPSDTEGFTEVGTFELDIDPLNQQTDETLTHKGDHIFIVKAKEVLADSEDFKHANLNHFVYLDRATNAVVHQEEFTSTNDLPESVGEIDSEYSAQVGGEGNTGEDPSDLDANGATDAHERTDVSDTEEAAEEREEERSQTQDLEQDHTETEEEDEDETSETIPQLKERISTITDKAELQKVYEDEQNGKKRAGALKAIEDHASELEA